MEEQGLRGCAMNLQRTTYASAKHFDSEIIIL